MWNFYPRSPCGERLYVSYNQYNNTNHFYPRSPCGERPINDSVALQDIKFLSTLSLRRATTWARGSRVTYVEFLSTLSLRRATLDELCRMMGIKHFYPRSPCGERRNGKYYGDHVFRISIHALLAESDNRYIMLFAVIANFYPRSPCGERHR